MDELNSRQREAVVSTEGRIRVVAGAGTGKTKALTHRYAYIVNTLGIDPANILCLTFTNKAAAEMRQRIAAMVHSGDYNDFVCTIHGFCVKFLRKEIYRLGFPKGFSVLDEEDCKAIAKDTMDEMGIKRTEKTVKQFLTGIAADKALNGYIETYMLPGSVISDMQRRTSRLAGYVSRQMQHFALDFDDLINVTKYILDRFQDAREWWQNALNYIMVDEAQDCNLDDWDLIERLAAKHRNLFVVGDPDQSIYEWRGARPDLFVHFASDKDIVLDENYRSTPKILDIANSVIAHNKNRIPKDLFTRKAEGRTVIHFHGKTEKEEMEWVVGQVKILLGAGAAINDIAVLYRSGWQSRAIEQELLSAKLDYTIWGGTRFFERREIKDALSYLRLIAHPDDDLSFRRIINVPSRKLGRAWLERLQLLALTDGEALYPTLKAHLEELGREGAASFVALIEDAREYALTHRISDLLTRVLDRSGLKQAIREDQDEDRLENLDELLSSIRFYETARREEEVTLADYLQDIALYTNDDHRKDTPTLKLMTIHQAKGLEFPYVFVIGLSEGIFPNMRSIREYKKNGEEEERRLMYVAVTRAEKALFLTESEGYNIATKLNKYPSRFLAEIKRETLVTEGVIPEDLWRGTRNLVHVLDEEMDPHRPVRLSTEGAFPGDAGDDPFAAERAAYNSPFQVGDIVSHAVFGEGRILSANKDWTTFEVEFPGGTVRSIRSHFLSRPDLPE
ncbi:MAG: UvrD-helicase domain-containing protein [Bacteroidales bacterium]|nr:UvrD-helicase domain-containing protein [Bacteroidales bacterium]